MGQFYAGPHIGLTIVTQHGSDDAWFGQGYGNAEAYRRRWRHNLRGSHSQWLPSKQCAGHNSSGRIAVAQLERRHLRGSLHLQSSADFHQPV